MGPQLWQLALIVSTVLYNPLSVTDGFRLEEISSIFRSIDFVFLPGTQGKQYDDGTVSEYGLSPGHLATEQLKDIVETYDLAYLVTFSDAGPTLFGSKTSSYIEHIWAPRGLARESRAWTSRRAMRTLLLIPTVAPRNHFPPFVEFRPCRRVPANVTQTKQKADYKDALMKALRTGERREAFVVCLQQSIPEIDQDEWGRASTVMYPDRNWRAWREALNQATTQAFPKVAKKTTSTRSAKNGQCDTADA